MKKKVLLGLAIGMSLSTVAFASPLQNYDAGKAEVNVGTTLAPAMASGSDNGETFKSDVKNKINGGATVGLGRNLALQFKYVDSQQKPESWKGGRKREHRRSTDFVHNSWIQSRCFLAKL